MESRLIQFGRNKYLLLIHQLKIKYEQTPPQVLLHNLRVDYVIIPGVEFVHILFSVDELKGGICSYQIESNEIPQVADFSVLDGSIEGPDSEWEFIDSLFFKGNKLEITSYLDSDCKSSEIVIYSN